MNRDEREGRTEDEIDGWCHRLKGHEFEQARGFGDGQGSLACCRPWGLKDLEMTEQLNNNKNSGHQLMLLFSNK